MPDVNSFRATHNSNSSGQTTVQWIKSDGYTNQQFIDNSTKNKN